MPRGDKTGPLGMGAMTGRGAGYCSGAGMPGYENDMLGRGGAMGFGNRCFGGSRRFGGGGRGYRAMYYATGLPGWMRGGGSTAFSMQPDADMERQALNNQAKALQTELDGINRRLAEIEAGSADK